MALNDEVQRIERRTETAASINNELDALCLPLGTFVQRHQQPTPPPGITVAMGLALDVHTRFYRERDAPTTKKGPV